MDINIFISLDELIELSKTLSNNTSLTSYGADSSETPYRPLTTSNNDEWGNAFKIDVLIGPPPDQSNILDLPQRQVLREERRSFITISYGGEDDFALGASRFSADPSPTSRFVNKELRKLLKKYAHSGVKTCNGDIISNHFWTDGALASGKNWHRFLRAGKYQAMNQEHGYTPKTTMDNKPKHYNRNRC